MFVSASSTKSISTDQELLLEYADSGDLEVLGVLYDRYIHLVYGVSLKYLKDREESKDVVMSIFEKLISDLKKHEVKNFKSWLHVITKNFCLMKLRSSKNSLEDSNSEIISQKSMEFAIHEHHEDGTLEDDLILLENCIEELKEEQQISVRLFFIEQKCYRDVASATGFKEKKVKSYIQNAKRNLKLCVEKHRERA